MFKDLLKRLREWWSPPAPQSTPSIPVPPIQPKPTQKRAYKKGPTAPVARPEAVDTPADTPRPAEAVAGKPKAPIPIPASDGGRVLTVRVGLDFGTAFTKAAIRVAESVLPVRWIEEIGNDGYFLPGVLSEMKDGTIRLGSHPNAIVEYRELKAPFLPGATATDLDRARAIAFVALVLRYCREFLYQTQQALIQRRRLAWVLNIGCPTNIYDAEALTDNYQRMFLVAWEISQSSADIRIPDLIAMLRGPSKSPDAIGLDSLAAIPEFVAQVAVYARSPQRQDGLHLLVDCGAGTLDIATFNVAREIGTNEDIYPIFESEVAPLGTHFLMNEFSNVNRDAVWSDAEPVPTNAELRERFGLKDTAIQQTNNRFRERIIETVLMVLRYTKQHRSPLAQSWLSGLPVFLSGGGASCPLYESSVRKACGGIPVEFKYSPFPLPEGLSSPIDLPRDEFHRLSVAFGLTYDPEIIGKVYRTSETSNMRLRHKHRPDRDDLYAK